MAFPPDVAAGLDFRAPERARERWSQLERRLGREEAARAALLLRQAPDPDSSLETLASFLELESDAVEAIRSSGRLLHALIALASHSRFLAEAVLRRPEILVWAMDKERFDRVLSADEFRVDLGWIAPQRSDEEAALEVARFKRMQLVRIALRDILGEASLGEIALELSNLADAVLQGAHDHIWQQLEKRFGRPLVPASSEQMLEGRFVVLALGKLGGQELNYSSDIDLLYLHTGEGETRGPVRTSNSDFYRQLANRLTALLSHRTPEGFAYRVDLRLRPEGGAGDLISSLDGAVGYYHDRARDWELQMLIKARPAAGDRRLGAGFLRIVQPLIYQTTTDFSVIERMAETRDRIRRGLERRRRRRIDIKRDRGGIRDIEFLVQCLQRLYGGPDPFVRSGGTLFALHRLREKGYLSQLDYARLHSAYVYLRTLEHRLQLVDDRQTHDLPDDLAQLRLIERQMQAITAPSGAPGDLLAQFRLHTTQVAEIYDRVVRAQRPTERIPEQQQEEEEASTPLDHSWRGQLRHLERRSAELVEAFEALPIRRGAKTFGHFLDQIVLRPELLDEFERRPALVACVGDLIEHSPYLGERLVRYPDDVRYLIPIVEEEGQPPERDAGARPDFTGFEADAAKERLYAAKTPFDVKCKRLRRIYRRRMLDLLAGSVFQGRPIFRTLARASDLAEWVVRAAYRIAVEELGTPETPPLQVVALGRLGMREFDLGSDADIVFVLPDEAQAERLHWRRIVERLIEIITSYTAEGRIFTVDARLRPQGRDGDLVQTESAYLSYFAERAEAWEALTYLKARTVAGDIQRGKDFLSKLQEVGWRRFGLDADLARLLDSMRRRLETEQGGQKPLKAGAGGYYDIDFILLYLRLKSAGVFFEYLSTPQRIDLVRTFGELTPEQGDFLFRAAVFFRSLDHAVRVSSGRSADKLPSSPAEQAILSALLKRWSVIQPAAQPLRSLADHVRHETRALYRRILGG